MSNSVPKIPEQKQPLRRVVPVILVGLVAWATLQVLGASRGAPSTGDNYVRGIVVAVSFAVFIGIWLVLLFSLKRRMAKQEANRPTSRADGTSSG